MIDALKFVSGAVARKDFVPELKHFLIREGKVRATNGTMTICSPINIDVEAMPRADLFLKAVRACKAETSLSITATGRLAVKSGKFKAYINCLEDFEAAHFTEPSGQRVEVTENFFTALKKVAPFMAIDASRSWAMAACWRGASLFATNNIQAVEVWHGTHTGQDVLIPADVVEEVIGNGEAPVAVYIDPGNSISFVYEDERWICSQLIDGEFPAQVSDVIAELAKTPQDAIPLPDDFWDAMLIIKPFLAEGTQVVLGENCLKTSLVEGEGASVEIDFPTDVEPIYAYKPLELLKGVITAINVDNAPKACPMYGEAIRGIMVGMRVAGS